MIVTPSRYKRRSRVNVDSLLAFDGVDQFADAGVNQNVIGAIEYDRDFAVVLLVNLLDFSDTRFLVSNQTPGAFDGFNVYTTSNGRLYASLATSNTNRIVQYVTIGSQSRLAFIYINYDAATQRFGMYVNGIGYSASNTATDLISSSIYSGAPTLKFSKRDGYNGTTNYTALDMACSYIFNRTLTETEIRSIHRYGGYLPQSTHAACVAHYVADKEGAVMWDCVEQYNYAKATPLTAYHASLQNFTPAQVEGSAQDAYLDFYTKSAPVFQGVDLQDVRFASSDTLSQTTISGNDWSTYLQFSVTNYPNDNYALVWQFGTMLRFRFRGTPAQSYLTLSRVNNNSVTPNLLTDFTTNKVSLERVNHIVVAYNATTQELTTYLNEQVASVLTSIPSISNASDPALVITADNNLPVGFQIYRLAFFSEHLSLSKIRQLSKDKVVGSETIDYRFNGLEDTVNLVNPGTFDLTYLKGSNANYIGSERVLEKFSLLPPLHNSLRFDAAQNQYASVSGFTPSKESGYTIVCAIQNSSPPSAVEHLFSMNSASFRAYYTPTLIALSNSTGVGGGGVLSYSGNIDFTSISLLTFTIRLDHDNTKAFSQIYFNDRLVAEGGGTGTYVGFDELSGLLKIGRNTAGDDYNGNILLFGIAKGIITPRQVIELWNNSLLANPNASWKNLEWQLLPNFNQINDNSGTYTLTDNSSKNHTITLSGYSAANIDPNDPAYSLTDINSLR